MQSASTVTALIDDPEHLLLFELARDRAKYTATRESQSCPALAPSHLTNAFRCSTRSAVNIQTGKAQKPAATSNPFGFCPLALKSTPAYRPMTLAIGARTGSTGMDRVRCGRRKVTTAWLQQRCVRGSGLLWRCTETGVQQGGCFARCRFPNGLCHDTDFCPHHPAFRNVTLIPMKDKTRQVMCWHLRKCSRCSLQKIAAAI